MWECPRCSNININDEPSCINCGLSRAKQYMDAPVEKLMEISERRADYTLDTLRDVCDALTAKGRAAEAEELSGYIAQRKIEETKKADPKELLKKLLAGTGTCGGIGFLLKIITGSLQQGDEYLAAEGVVRLGKMFGSSGNELNEAKSYVQGVDFFSGLGTFLLLAAVVLVVIYFVIRMNQRPVSADGTPQAPMAGLRNAPLPLDGTAGADGGIPEGERNFCTQCGGPIQAGDAFCAKCGRKLI